jgi:hypothetical protein
MYCSSCLSILAPLDQWPRCLREGKLSLPFLIDIVLDDRRVVSTGVQIATLLESMTSLQRPPHHHNLPRFYRMFDMEAGDQIPDYELDAEHDNYLLYPGPTSVPLSSVLDSSRERTDGERPMRLVVLDCKWARRSIRLHPSVSRLPQVRLDDPPAQSQYWRWHNSGEGMLSTVEAVYYASWQVATGNRWSQDRLENLTSLFWLFRYQREAVKYSYEHGYGRYHASPPPFTEAGKEFHRTKHKHRHPPRNTRSVPPPPDP